MRWDRGSLGTPFSRQKTDANCQKNTITGYSVYSEKNCYSIYSAIGSTIDGIRFRSFRNQNRSQKNTITVNSVYSHSSPKRTHPERKLQLHQMIRLNFHQSTESSTPYLVERVVKCLAFVAGSPGKGRGGEGRGGGAGAPPARSLQFPLPIPPLPRRASYAGY